jgi:glycosyltransferase 2 family protein
MPNFSQRRSIPWWSIGKLIIGAAILIFIGRHFARDLPPGEALKLLEDCRPGWLVAAAAFYIAGLGMSLWFWYRLLWQLNQRPGWLEAIRAYYIGHMGKYLPGKAWALALRAGLIKSDRVRLSVAVATSLYEVLVTMAGAVLLAAVLTLTWFSWPAASVREAPLLHPLWSLLRLTDPGPRIIEPDVLLRLCAILGAVVGCPILPPLYNRLVARISLPFRRDGQEAAVPIRWGSWLEGLAITGCAWLILGLSLWSVIKSLLPNFEITYFVPCCVYLALAYVAGFVIVFVPSGLGVREFCLQVFLVQEFIQHLGLHDRQAVQIGVLIVWLLRVVWTAAEVLTVSLIYCLPRTGGGAAGPSRRSEEVPA